MSSLRQGRIPISQGKRQPFDAYWAKRRTGRKKGFVGKRLSFAVVYSTTMRGLTGRESEILLSCELERTGGVEETKREPCFKRGNYPQAGRMSESSRRGAAISEEEPLYCNA